MTGDKKEVVVTDKSPLPLKPSPYSAAVKHGGLVFCSGNIGMNPVNEKLVEGDVGDRTVMIHFPCDYTHLTINSNGLWRLLFEYPSELLQ